MQRLDSLKTIKENHAMIETTALIIEAFGLGSLSLSFAKYTLLRRKSMNAKN
jgi:hypothetical protein